MAALRAEVDLLELLGRDTPLRRVAGTGGGEWAGPCPFCGGRDRFRVQPRLGYWWCRRCGGERWQDAIDYLRRRDGVDFAEACRRSGRIGPSASASSRLRRAERPSTRRDTPPSATWQEAGRALVAESERILWSEAGRAARTYLARRGLAETTLRAWRVGFQPVYGRRELAERWGFPPIDTNGAPTWVRIPRGIVLPWFLGGQLWQIKVRTAGADQPKYLAVSGGRPCLYGGDLCIAGAAGVLVEGEFDTQLVWQEARRLASALTLGSASRWPTEIALRYLAGCSRLLVATDADTEGDRWAERLAGVVSKDSRRVVPPAGKDVTDYWRSGGDVTGWIRAELDRP